MRLLDIFNRFFGKTPKPAQVPKILCVSHDAGFYGAQILMLHIAQVLKRQLGFDVAMLLLGGGPLRPQLDEVCDVVDFTYPPWRSKLTPAVLRTRRRQVKRLRKAGYRHAICNTSISGHVLQMLKDQGFQTVVLIHELPNLIQEFDLEFPVKEIGRLADLAVFPALFVRDRFLPVAGLDVGRTVIRPQGLYRSSPYRNRRKEAKESMIATKNLAPNVCIVVAAGQGDKRKGIDLFFQVAAKVVQVLPHAHFIWIGDDSPDTALECKAMVRREGLQGNVHFTGVLQDPDMYLCHIAAADLYLMTSREDPFPSVVLDAMEVAIPVVGFEGAGGFTELLRQGAGVVVPFENTQAMAETVIELLAEPEHADRMGAVGQRIIDERFNFVDYVYDLARLAGHERRRISVVVPNYNYAHYLPTRLQTILNQTYRPYEIIFLDDKSSDDSVAIAESILSRSGIPFRIVKNEVNQGCYAQWLSGIEIARGELLWIAEADDQSDVTFLEELAKGFDDPEVVLAYSQSRTIDEKSNLTSPNYLGYTNELSKTKWLELYVRAGRDEIADTLAVKNTIPNASGVLMKKPDLSDIRDRLLKLKNAGDWLTYTHILEAGSLYFTPKVLNSHRVHAGGITRGGNALRLMSEIIQVQHYIRSRHSLSDDTIQKTERMRQFTYSYLGLQDSGVPNYQDHPELRVLLENKQTTLA